MRESEFEEFARARAPQLLRSAWLLCGDRHLAEDLVQETLAKVYVRLARLDNPAAYAQTTLVRTYLSLRRRRSSTEQPYADLPDRAVDGNGAEQHGKGGCGQRDDRAALEAIDDVFVHLGPMRRIRTGAEWIRLSHGEQGPGVWRRQLMVMTILPRPWPVSRSRWAATMSAMA